MFSVTIMSGEEVREKRRARGWTVERLAKISGVSAAMISQVENEKRRMGVSVAQRLDVALSKESE